MYHSPIALDNVRSSRQVRAREVLSIAQDLSDLCMWFNSRVGIRGRRPAQIIFVHNVQLGQMHLHVTRCHEREPSIDTICCEVLGQRAQEKTSKHASKTSAVGIPLAIVETPRG